jgi:hypothetical protein
MTEPTKMPRRRILFLPKGRHPQMHRCEFFKILHFYAIFFNLLRSEPLVEVQGIA